MRSQGEASFGAESKRIVDSVLSSRTSMPTEVAATPMNLVRPQAISTSCERPYTTHQEAQICNKRELEAHRALAKGD